VSPQPYRAATTCGHCGEHRPCSRVILEQRVCQRCMLRFRRAPKPCPGCDQIKVLAFHDAQRQPSCAACTGNDPVYACIECGREDNPFGRRCGPCEVHVRLTGLLSDPSGRIHPRLQPVFDTLLAAPRPQSTLYWLTRSSSRPDILRNMACGELDISHATFEAMPDHRAVRYLRDLLAGVGVLAPYHPGLERITPWLRGILASAPKQHADLIDRFARWQLLRRLRLLGGQDRITRGSEQNARATILSTVRFLRWLDEHDTTITATTQADLDHYLVRYPGRAPMIAVFLDWTTRTGITADLQVPAASRPLPEVTLSDHDRWRHVERLLHDDTMQLYARIAGLFILLFAQPLSRICRMKPEQVALRSDGTVAVTFDKVPIEMPELLDGLVLDQLARSRHDRYANHQKRWLFPGRHASRHLATENIRKRLVSCGIHPFDARKAAMFQLAAEIPTPILGELLGLSPTTATRWATLAARDWSQYAAMRRATTV
jgi:hypothetical protein